MTSAYSINLNFNNTIPVKTDFTFKQGDKGITLNLATTGLDPTGTTAHIVFKRSNGTSVEAQLTGQTGPSYSYTILGNEFEIPGVVVADLKLYDGDTQRVSTASFIFLVTGDTMDGVGGGTGGYSDQLEQLSAEFQDTLDDYIDAFGNTAPINPRGDYDNTATYEPRDMVFDSNTGTSWVCKQESTGNAPTNGSAYWQQLVSSAGSSSLGDLADVDTTGAASGQLLGYDGADWGPVNAPDGTFAGLSDVDTTGVTNGQVPTYDGTSQKWKPATPSPGGVTSFNNRTGAVTPKSGDYSADKISYDNTSSGLIATNANAAIDESNVYIKRSKGCYLPLINLGTAYTAELKNDISSGAFKIAIVGGYLTINGRVYIFAHPDYWLNTGSTKCTTHHMVVVPAAPLGEGKMNSTDIVTGGYLGSDIKTGANSNTALSSARATIINDFGAANILTHKGLFTNAVSGGQASGWSWSDSDVDLMSESMVYGHNAWGNANFEVGIDKVQLELFAKRPDLIQDSFKWWLRDVSATNKFSYVYEYGNSDRRESSYSFGVRPAFAIC